MDQEILDVARTIGPYLPELVGDEANAYDNKIKELLAQADDGVDVGDEIWAVLTRSPRVEDWVSRVFEDDQHRPPEFVPPRRQAGRDPGAQPPPTPVPTPIVAEKYVCPVDGNDMWYRPSVGYPVPDCEHHTGVKLVRAVPDGQ